MDSLILWRREENIYMRQSRLPNGIRANSIGNSRSARRTARDGPAVLETDNPIELPAPKAGARGQLAGNYKKSNHQDKSDSKRTKCRNATQNNTKESSRGRETLVLNTQCDQANRMVTTCWNSLTTEPKKELGEQAKTQLLSAAWKRREKQLA